MGLEIENIRSEENSNEIEPLFDGFVGLRTGRSFEIIVDRVDVVKG